MYKRQAGASQSAVVFLTIYPGARPVGMGGAYVGLAEGPLATYYNEGGLASEKRIGAVFMHSSWLPALNSGMYYEFFGITLPTSRIGGMEDIGGTFGLDIIYLTTGETEAIDETGTPIAVFSTFDLAVELCYGMQINERLSVGAGAKFIYSFLAPTWIVQRILHKTGGGKGTSWAIDVSMLYKILPKLGLGISLQNLGPDITYLGDEGQYDPLPRMIKAGFAWKLVEDELQTLTALMDISYVFAGVESNYSRIGEDYTFGDFISDEWEEVWKSCGLEYNYYNFLSARIGYFIDSAGERVGFTFGGGLEYQDKLELNVGVDSDIYSFDCSNYRISLTLFF